MVDPLKSRKLHEKQIRLIRINEILDAIKDTKLNTSIPSDWMDELDELVETHNNNFAE